MTTTQACIVLTTCPERRLAQDIAEGLVTRQLAACVNILPAIHSVYRWQGAVQHDDELLMIIKAMTSQFAAIRDYILELHPYELPEIIAVPIVDGLEPYLQWLQQPNGAP